MMFRVFKRRKPEKKMVEIVSWDGYSVKPLKGEIRIDRIKKSRQEEPQNDDLLHLQNVGSPERGPRGAWRGARKKVRCPLVC
jgi:hypothetical protein